MSHRFAVLPQYLLPKRGLTVLMGRGASKEGGALTTAVIRWFIGRYGVDMSEAADPDPTHYRTFNAFFTRALKEGARPLQGYFAAGHRFLSPTTILHSEFCTLNLLLPCGPPPIKPSSSWLTPKAATPTPSIG